MLVIRAGLVAFVRRADSRAQTLMGHAGGGAESVAEQIAVQVTTAGGHPIVRASGEIDLASAPVLRAAMDTVIGDGVRQIIVDLQDVTFIDSTGLNLLIAVLKQLGPGSISVVTARPQVCRVLAISGIDTLIPIFDSVATAVEAATKNPPE